MLNQTNGRIFHRRMRLRPRTSREGTLPWVSLLAACLLLAIGRISPHVLEPLREAITLFIAPVASAVATVTGGAQDVTRRAAAAVLLLREVDRLRAENARLAALAGRSDMLERDRAELQALAGHTGQGERADIVAQVIATSPAGAARTLLIDAGRRHGVREGQPVASSLGLAGRVVQARENTATVLLLADRLSRVPVAIGKTQVRGVLAGTGGDRPRLEFVPGEAAIATGDMVFTSGVGGLFPRDLLVGSVVEDGRTMTVALAASDSALLYVRVLLGEVPALDGSELAGARGGRGVVK